MLKISPQNFTDLAKYLKTPLGKISTSNTLFTRTLNNSTSKGAMNIIFALLKDSNSNLRPTNKLIEIEIRQWLEYILIYVGNASNSQHTQNILADLNDFLKVKTYLVGNAFTIADALLYYVLFNVMTNLSNIDKEKYINVSRWFDNIQQDSTLRQNYNIVDFSTNYLASIVPAKH
ncbi:eukaryotic translation elongation factor 1 epsilon-1 [Sitophilus oryzae]|uniref:Eukaryotic translation elongation factor 1 epsilon-1 n=1 Tax=Sitophilus oryzae TaxID=7048 RepID=A0A6J2YRN5_SITOR|nr:eukaryotic translation elongation factor 1 epsilon-1 [Sitophilus oryzae]